MYSTHNAYALTGTDPWNFLEKTLQLSLLCLRSSGRYWQYVFQCRFPAFNLRFFRRFLLLIITQDSNTSDWKGEHWRAAEISANGKKSGWGFSSPGSNLYKSCTVLRKYYTLLLKTLLCKLYSGSQVTMENKAQMRHSNVKKYLNKIVILFLDRDSTKWSLCAFLHGDMGLCTDNQDVGLLPTDLCTDLQT